MLFKRLPNPTDYQTLTTFLWADDTIVVHDRAECVSYSRHKAPLSLKAVLSGAESYDVHGFYDTVGPDDYLMINSKQHYRSRIESTKPVETLSIFFSQRDVADLTRFSLADTRLVDDPTITGSAIEFAAVRRQMPDGLKALLRSLPNLKSQPHAERQEQAVRMLQMLFASEKDRYRGADVQGAARPSLRAELYRRCSVARAFMEAHYCEDISLSNVAEIALVSRSHLVRAFTHFFGEAPSLYLRRLRMTRAAELLEHGWPVSDIGIEVGYADLSAFSRAFKAYYSTAPRNFRHAFASSN